MSHTPTFYLLDEFLETDFKRPAFIIDKWLPYGGEPCLFFGDPGTGKSFLCNNIIKSIADGVPLLGQFKTMQGRVAYCSFDMPVQMLEKRLKRLRENLEHPENVAIINSDNPINILKATEEDDWVAQVLDFQPLVVILDTLSKIHFMDPSDPKAVSGVYGKLMTLFGSRITPLLMAHQRKYGQLDNKERAAQRITGHYSWVWNSDFAVQLTKDERFKPIKVTLEFARVRHCAPMDAIETELNPRTSLLEIKMSPALRARELLLEHPGMPETDVVKILLEEELCSRAQAYKVAKTTLVRLDEEKWDETA